jgi:hypothetical protein
MSDISGQLIKNSYNYILQADTSTGYVFRVGGDVPVNPIFSSGLTVFSAFTFVDGNQQNGYVLTSDTNGNSRWAAVSGASVSSVTASTGLSGNSTTGAITLINTQVQGITGITASSGLSASTSNNVVTLINTGVTGITAGTNITINQSTGNVTINSTGGGTGLGTVYTTANNFNFL